MGRSGWFTIVGCALVAAGGGWLLAGVIGAIVGTGLGAGLGAAAALLQMRPVVALALVASLAIGAIIGQGIVHALCLPDGCVAAESVGAVVLSVAAVIAVGLVVALVARSFEEYQEAVTARRPPPEPGCETDETRGSETETRGSETGESNAT